MSVLINRSSFITKLILILSVLSGYFLFDSVNTLSELTDEGCTIGVVSGNSTADGKPILWKVRDNSDMPNNDLVYNTACLYKFITVVNNGDTNVWMGVNEKGLAIVNSTSYDLPGTGNGYSNGALMTYALGYCSSVEEFEKILIETNLTGRKTRANFALIDSSGAAVLYETSGKEFWKFDANNKLQSPNGYVIRTNFSFNGGGSTGVERFRRTLSLFEDLHRENNLSHQSIIKYHLRDFSNQHSEHINIPFKDRWYSNKPFGYINSNYSVCRSVSLSASVYHGVLPSQPAKTTTMWTALGNPSTSIVMPYWAVGETPALTRGEIISPLFKVSEEIKSYLYDDLSNRTYFDSYKLKDDNTFGIQNRVFTFEDSIFTLVRLKLENRSTNYFDSDDLLQLEHQITGSGYAVLSEIKSDLEKLIKIEVLNDKPWNQINNITFNEGSIIQLISAGKNGKIDLPVLNNSDINFGMPGGDDYLIGGMHHLGENCDDAGKFYFPLLLWKNHSRLPYIGDGIYLRLFDTGELVTAAYYGNSQVYKISNAGKQQFKQEVTEVFGINPGGDSYILASNSPGFKISDNFPNPFNSVTAFNYSIPVGTNVQIEIFNSLGEKVQTLLNEFKNKGQYTVIFDASGYSSGIYFYRFTADKFVSIKKMILMK